MHKHSLKNNYKMKSCNTQTRSKHYQHFSNGSVSLCGCTLFLKIFKEFWLYPVAFRALVPQSGIEPVPPHWKGES